MRNSLFMLIFNDYCVVFSIKSLYYDFFNRIVWLWNGSCRKEGIFFVYLIDMNRSLVVVLNV